MARLKSALERSNTTYVDDEKKHNKLTRAFAVGMGGAVLSSVALFGAASANADPGVNIEVGGATDDTSSYIDSELHNNGTIQPGEIAIPIQHPADIGPFVGPTPMRDSVNIGAQAIVDQVHQAQANYPGMPITAHCFSEGSAECNEANKILRGQGININVNNHGDGYAASGVLNNPMAETFGPILNGFGIPAAHELAPQPGTVEKIDVHDFWGTGASALDDIGKAVNDLFTIPQNHRIIGPNEVPTQVFNKDGVTYQIFNGTIPLPPGATDGPAGPAGPIAPAIGEIPPSPQAEPQYVQPRPEPVVTPAQEQAILSAPKLEDVPPPVPGQPLTPDQQALTDAFVASLPALP